MNWIKPDPEVVDCGVLVVGGGLSAASAAVHALEAGADVCMAVKGKLGCVGLRGSGASSCGSTFSGMARIPGLYTEEEYDPDDQYRKVIAAGMGMAERGLAQLLIEGAVAMQETVKRWGVVWEKSGPVGLGFPVVSNLEARLRYSPCRILEHTMIVDLLGQDGACVGAMGVRRDGTPVAFRCGAVILATGGDAELFRYNVHPSCVTGDGYAMALRAGARLMNMEFNQIFFATVHPTRNLIHFWAGDELGRVVNADGREFLSDYLPPGVSIQACVEENLRHAPFSTRDRASRYLGLSIVKEVQAGRGTEHGGVLVELPDTGDPRDREQTEFFRFRGIDHSAGPVEMTMAHQCSNGGMRIDSGAMTGVPGLFGAGEATTGMHGADRLGGNMMANCMVFGALAGRSAAGWSSKRKPPAASDVRRLAAGPLAEVSDLASRKGTASAAELRKRLQLSGWNNGLTVRSKLSLSRMSDDVKALTAESKSLTVESPDDLVAALELRNLLLVGEVVARAATERRECRGGHYREDCPEQTERTPAAVVVRLDEGGGLSLEREVVDPEWREEDGRLGDARWG